ncbi:MAG: hypothetical protein ACI8P3_003353 [Saprospiraceae bacterium]|jgi:hypothetical protein
MAKTKRKLAIEARNKREASKLLKVVLIGGAVLIVLMYILYKGMS